MNLFNYDAESAETTAFDVKPCLRWDEQRFLQFALNGECDMECGKECSLRIWGTSRADCQVRNFGS